VTAGSPLAERLTAQLLAGPRARGAVEATGRVFAVQGQDPRGFRLAVRARTQGVVAADVDRALTEERSLVVTWLNRGTLHLVRSEDYPVIQAVTAPPLRRTSERRLGQEGVPPDHVERAIETIERSLSEEGPLTSHALRERIAATGVRAEGQALYHVLFQASLRGLLVRGPMAGAKHAYVLVRDWIPDAKPVDRDRALGEFARRYLAGHAPADDRDLARWAGISLRDARAALAAAGPAPKREPADLPPPRLLGAFEPLLLGWTSRTDVLGEKSPNLVTVGGMFHPFVLVGGKAVARWKLTPDGQLELDPFRRISKADLAALDDDAEDVKRFLG
jgi:hypothetical protein